MRATTQRSLVLLVLAAGALGAIVFYACGYWIARVSLAQCEDSLKDRAVSLAVAGSRSINAMEHQTIFDAGSP